MTGKTISHYEIAEKLGGGSAGVIYKARDFRLNREVVIRFLPQQSAIKDEAWERFLINFQTLAALNHPYITAMTTSPQLQHQHPELCNLPGEFVLAQNHLNPFNPTTPIRFSVPETSEVNLSILSLTARRIFSAPMWRAELTSTNSKPKGLWQPGS